MGAAGGCGDPIDVGAKGLLGRFSPLKRGLDPYPFISLKVETLWDRRAALLLGDDFLQKIRDPAFVMKGVEILPLNLVLVDNLQPLMEKGLCLNREEIVSGLNFWRPKISGSGRK